MSAFPKMLLTNVGIALQAKVQSGVTLELTRIGLGDGNLNGQPISPLKNLINQTVSVPIMDGKQIINSNTLQVPGFFSNKDVQVGFWWREFGVFANDPDSGEILYAYSNAGNAGDYIPTIADQRIEKLIYASFTVQNAENVNITIPQSDTFIPKKEKGAKDGVATLDETGKIPQDQLPELDFIPNSEKGQPDGVAPLNKDGVLDIIYGGTKAKTAQEALYNLGCGVRQNLIKNGYFIGGRTNNALPINQKGSRTYSTGQSIDCWKLSGVGSQNIRLDSDGIAIYSNAENGAYLTQILDEDIIQQIKGQTVTLSALFAYNNARLAMYLDINDEIIGGTGWETNTGFISAKINIPQEIESAKIFFGAEIKGEAKVKLCKMEIGDTQTLCWQNTSKQWIPFEKPDYSTELLKCQRYYQIYSSAENRPNSYIDCRPVMRKPDDGEITQGTIQINDVTYYYNSAEL